MCTWDGALLHVQGPAVASGIGRAQLAFGVLALLHWQGRGTSSEQTELQTEPEARLETVQDSGVGYNPRLRKKHYYNKTEQDDGEQSPRTGCGSDKIIENATQWTHKILQKTVKHMITSQRQYTQKNNNPDFCKLIQVLQKRLELWSLPLRSFEEATREDSW
jgi:hypothetical protein